MEELIKTEILEHIAVQNLVARDLVPQIGRAARLMIDALKTGNKIIFFGNGGSAADAQHLAAELVGRYRRDRKALAALALTTDTSIMTAVANDFGFNTIFSRQLEGLAQPGDVAVGISTSGNSPNVFEGLEKALKLKCKTIGLLGGKGGKIAGLVHVALTVPSEQTPRIQESHITIGHILCRLVEEALF